MSNNPYFGSWVQIGHPAIAEILAQAGLSWLALDCEHGEAEDADIGNFCRACNQHQVKPLVRVKENAVMPIRRALDLGAQGVIIPLVNNRVEAEQAVKSANFPPNGIRGFAWQRGNQWGVNFDQYAKNFRPLVIVMIESKTAVENIDEILGVAGIDGVLIGPYDLSGSYGITGQTSHQLIVDACAKVGAAATKHNKLAGYHIVTPNSTNVKTAIAQGYNFIALGMDSYFLQSGIKQALELVK